MVCNKCWGPCPCFLLCSLLGACRLETRGSKLLLLLPPLAYSPRGWWDGLVSSHPRSRSHQKVHAGSTLKPGEKGLSSPKPLRASMEEADRAPSWPHPHSPKMLGSECSINARLLALLPSPGPSLVLWLA